MKRGAHGTVTPRAKVWFEVDGEYAFGLGICLILEAVDQTGAIKAAAAAVGKSYRHVWTRIKRAEQSLGFALVDTQVGGAGTRRSMLTEPARELTTRYRRIRDEVLALVDAQFSTSLQEVADRSVDR